MTNKMIIGPRYYFLHLKKDPDNIVIFYLEALKMAAVIRLTAGLRHMPVPRLLKPGEIFIVRFKNALRGYKVDVWIGVVLPHKFGPDRHLRRPPVGAQPEEGQWLTHLKDRMYPLYLPGRNM
jgi:hypothetical protein